MKMVTTLDKKNFKIRTYLVKDVELRKIMNMFGRGNELPQGETFLYFESQGELQPVNIQNPSKKERRKLPHTTAEPWYEQEVAKFTQ